MVKFFRVGNRTPTKMRGTIGHFRGWVAKPLFLLMILASFPISITTLPSLGIAPIPPLQVHPLPATLEQWQPEQQDDYFSSLTSSPVGALIWTEFPIKVYLDRPSTLEGENTSFLAWVKAVETAIGQWNIYLPMVEILGKDRADIIITRDFPPIGATFNPETGQLEIPRARTAQTRYDLATTQSQPPILIHRMTVEISPRLSESSLLSAARHELGHALGIWGHSPVETDALYFSQVRNSPDISVRDINTLKRVYRQPTRLGGSLPNS